MNRHLLILSSLSVLLTAVSLLSAPGQPAQSRPRGLPCNLPPYSMPQPGRDRGLFLTPRWKPGEVIHVYFLNGNSEVRGIVEHYAREWERFGNFRFQFHQEPKTSKEVAILIQFAKQEGNVLGWSAVGSGTSGTDAPSMEFAPYGPDEFHDTPAALGTSVVHEFGHALGLKHEQDNPRGAPLWKKDKAHEFFRQAGWKQEWIDEFLNQKVPGNMQATDFDPHSIMAYGISGENFVDGKDIGTVDLITAGDRAAIRLLYPGRAQPTRPLPMQLYTDSRPMVLNFAQENVEITVVVDGAAHTIQPYTIEDRRAGKKRPTVTIPADASRNIQVEWHFKPVDPTGNYDAGIWNYPGGNGDEQENWIRCTRRDNRFSNCVMDASFLLVHYSRRNTGQYVDTPDTQPQGDPNKLLLAAAASGDVAGVSGALSRGANINYAEERYTALMYATQYNRIEVVKLLLQKGAVNDKKSGISPSRIAIYNGFTELMTLLGPPEELSPEVRIRTMGPPR